MAKFLTEEWAKKYVETINESIEFSDSTKNFSGEVLITATNDRTVSLYLNLSQGKCLNWRILPECSGAKPDFEFKGSYKKWRKVIDKKIDLNQGIFSGEIEMVGDRRKLWSEYMRLSFYLGELMSMIETTF